MSSRPRHSRRCYTVAWDCSDHLCLTTAKRMLDELHQPLIQHAEDANIYVLGRVCSLNIVLACLSGMDNKSAAVGAARLRLRNTFPCIRLVITAGTADAITGEEVIRRGDLVVDISGLPRGPVLNAIMAQDTDRPSCLEEIAMAGIKRDRKSTRLNSSH